MKRLSHVLSLASLIGGMMLVAPAAALADGRDSHVAAASSDTVGSGSTECGRWRCGFNGVTLNGITFNGLTFNGFTVNGLRFNGFTVNGVTLNGRMFNGFSLNGVTLNGAKLNGVNASRLGSASGGEGAGAIVACADQLSGVCKPGVVSVTLAGGQRLTVD